MSREEHIAGTDHTNSLSYLKLDEISAGSSATLRFSAVAYRTYAIQYTDALESGLWLRLTDVLAEETDRTEVVLDPAPGSERYYRIVTPWQP